MRKSLIALLGAGLLFSSAVFALTLDQAKQQGRVGETLSGYIVAIKQDKETLALVQQINTGRAEKYQEVANNNHISREDVAKMAGQKLVERAASSEYVRGINSPSLSDRNTATKKRASDQTERVFYFLLTTLSRHRR